jgi:hypothetical protein
VLNREDANIEMRLDAYNLQGSSLAIVGDAVAAEKPFRFLLRGRPEFDMPARTSPKILAVFRKVQVEERAIAAQMQELERARIIKDLKLDLDMPEKARGGATLPFDFNLTDPGRSVQQIDVHYRRDPNDPYSTLALTLDGNGHWHGALPGEWSDNDKGFTLQYFVTTADAKNRELLNAGAATSPFSIEVAPGTMAQAHAFYRSPWFWTIAGASLAALGVGGYVLLRKPVPRPSADGEVTVP